MIEQECVQICDYERKKARKKESVVMDNNYQLKSLNYLANTLLIEQEGLFANVHYNQSAN